MHRYAFGAANKTLQRAHQFRVRPVDLIDRDAAVTCVCDQQPALGIEDDIVGGRHLTLRKHAELL